MERSTRALRAWLVAAGLALAAPGAAPAQETFDCSELILVSASGVPLGDVHAYAFRGSCRLKAEEDGFLSSSTSLRTIEVEAAGKWDARTQEAVETVEVKGAGGGTVSTKMRCAADPWPKSDRGTGLGGGGPCTRTAGSNTTAYGVLSTRVPVTAGIADPVEARYLSDRAAANPSPPPPPPPEKGPPTLQEVPERGPPVLREAPRRTDSLRVSPEALRAAPRAGRVTVPPPPPPPVEEKPAPGGEVDERALRPQPEPPGKPVLLVPGRALELADGRTLRAREIEGRHVLEVIGSEGGVVETLPPGARVRTDDEGNVFVDLEGKIRRLGRLSPDRQ